MRLFTPSKPFNKIPLFGSLILLGIALVVQLFDLPTLALSTFHYDPEQLSTYLNNGVPDGFNRPEKDETGQLFDWTTPDPSLTFAFHTTRTLRLTFEMRNAAEAGGPNAPIPVLVNGQPAGQLTFDPAKPGWQTINLTLTPSPAAHLKIELQPAAFKPPKDSRTLGTMIRSITFDSDEWSSLVHRLRLILWSLVGLSFIILLLATQIARWATWLRVALRWGGLGVVFVATYQVAIFTDWQSDTTFLLVSFFLLGYLALWFWYGAAAEPLLNGLTLNRYALRTLVGSSLSKPLPPAPAKKALNSLTGLRMMAALLIFLTHLPGTAKQFPDWFINFKNIGLIGVPLFFVLSGFVICYNYYASLSIRPLSNLWSFLMARVARIYPLQLLVLAAAMLATWLTGGFGPVQRDPFNIVQQLTMVDSWNGYSAVRQAYLYNSPAWSLGVEFFLYLSFPVLAFTVLKWCRKVWQLVGLGLLGLAGPAVVAIYFTLTTAPDTVAVFPQVQPEFWVGRYPLTHLGDFVAGCVAARLYELWLNKPVGPREMWVSRFVLYGSVIALCFLMAYQPDQYFLFYFRPVALFLPFFTLIVFCVARYRTLLSRFLSTRVMVLLGEASFSFYMLHYFVIEFLSQDMDTYNTPVAIAYALFLLAISIGISLLAYFLIEKPARRLIRGWAERHSARPVAFHPDNTVLHNQEAEVAETAGLLH